MNGNNYDAPYCCRRRTDISKKKVDSKAFRQQKKAHFTRCYTVLLILLLYSLHRTTKDYSVVHPDIEKACMIVQPHASVATYAVMVRESCCYCRLVRKKGDGCRPQPQSGPASRLYLYMLVQSIPPIHSNKPNTYTLQWQ